LLDCSHGNVVNAIMIRKVPKATMNTKEQDSARSYPNRASAKKSTNLTVFLRLEKIALEVLINH